MKYVKLDLLSRIVSSFCTFILLVFLAKSMGLAEFAHLQVVYTACSLIIWVGDFGIAGSYLNLFAEQRTEFARRMWTLRTSILALLCILVFFAISVVYSSLNPLIFLACYLDVATDTNLNVRQVVSQSNFSKFLHVSKKLIQLSYFCSLFLSGSSVTSTNLFLGLGVPSASLLIYDQIILGKFTNALDYKYLKNTFRYWFQSGGTLLANFDFIILSFFGNLFTISAMTLPRKISNSIGIFGTSLSPHVQNEVAAKGDISDKSKILYRKIFYLASLCSLLACFAYPWAALNLFHFDFEKPELALGMIIIALIPVGIIATNQNARLLGLKLFRSATISNYSSSMIYLIFVYVGAISHNSYMVAFAIIINIFSELIMEIVFIRRARRAFANE